MINAAKIPTIKQFLSTPIEEIVKISPKTMIFNAGGTRRRAMLAGISPSSEEYPRWTQQQMLKTFDMIFQYGVRHIFTTVLAETNFSEVTPGYREKMFDWVKWGLAGTDAIADYARLGWQARLIGIEYIPELHATAERLVQETTKPNAPTIWFSVSTTMEEPWEAMFDISRKIGGKEGSITRREVIKQLYGEDIPLATMFLGNGKPLLFPGIIPLILVGKLQCYWRQHLGYDLDEQSFRKVLYDYAYLRRTWTSDKSGRTEQVLQFKEYWETPPILGLGQRLGPFWYPVA